MIEPGATLDKARALITGERHRAYGPPAQALGAVADAWRAYWAAKGLHVPFSAAIGEGII
ncbi:MAG: hypothetical protein C4525_03050 [Desulfarculus sp.]|nr:MAG: hypothetical protein C4525_03050 [Desulfarculus sp.]